ncbi:hypothetical protein KY326_04930 [Candidatus Woesearchaeota archaeon]|nr:hypothetical protein [Candidatus Woesearchaeota archaeon]
MKIGTLCMKIAGRDAGLKCVVISSPENSLVLIDGETRRKKCNIKHLQPLKQVLALKENASHSDVVSAFKKLGIEIKEKKSKPKTQKPVKKRKGKKRTAVPEAEARPKKAAKSQKPAKKKETKKKETK